MFPMEFMTRVKGIERLVMEGDDDFLVSVHHKNGTSDVMTPDVFALYGPSRYDPWTWIYLGPYSLVDCTNVVPVYKLYDIRGVYIES